MERFLSSANLSIYTYLLIPLLIACGVWFTIRTKGVQFRLFGQMWRSMLGSGKKKSDSKSMSSFQAFSVALAGRIGTGNIAGVATAIAVGGPGAIFWMWLVALLGSASAFVESTLAQLYKRKVGGHFIGGPAYYMERGLGKRWMGVLFSIIIILTFTFAFSSVQSNTICSAFEGAFHINRVWVGAIITAITLVVILGGAPRIAKVSSVIVPFMAIAYILLALIVVIMNISSIPEIFGLIFRSAFGWEQAAGGGIGAAVMQGVRRGLFSNEAGLGSAPNPAASADVAHPVRQGLVQALGVFIDTLFVCSCTAFIILSSGTYASDVESGLKGVELTQKALVGQVGSWGSIFIATAILFFAYSSIIGNYFYGEQNIRFITDKKWAVTTVRILTCVMVMLGALMSLDLAWELADITMAFMGLINLVALVYLCPKALALMKDFTDQRARGIKDPVYPDWWEEEQK